MKITNKYDLPQPIVDAVRGFIRNPPASDISVTELIGPPLIRLLKLDYHDQMEEDASERIWALLGSAVHAILDRADTLNHLQEERIFAKVEGWTISGQPDLLDHDGVLSDYKVTSAYTFMADGKREWEEQLNVYRWLFNSIGFEVSSLRIVAILRDWSRSRMERESDYPPTPVIVREIPMWTLDRAETFVRARVLLHKFAEDGEFEPCTDEERWHKDDAWAIMRKGRKRAVRVFNNFPDAEEWLKGETGDVSLLHRPGRDIRCESYCPVRNFCKYKREIFNADVPSRDSSD